MDQNFTQKLAQKGLKNEPITREDARAILTSPEIELLELLSAAFRVRQKFTGREVMIHIINNAQNGHCPEDCGYCAQAKTSKADIESYPTKTDSEILAEAKAAYNSGAHRYCMVFAGRGPSTSRVERLANLIKIIKSRYNLELCVSAGLLDVEKAKTLKNAGLDRLNHNLNTSEKFYPNICSTHTYNDRVKTLSAAKTAGIELCSGIIVGMGESYDDVIDVAYELRKMNAKSIPVNFLMSIEGNLIVHPKEELTPDYCLRVLSLFRFVNPKAEIRIAAGREIHLRSMEVMALYPANSLFMDGYLNTKGEERKRTLQMIKDAGFVIKSDQNLEELIGQESTQSICPSKGSETAMKTVSDLRPQLQN